MNRIARPQEPAPPPKPKPKPRQERPNNPAWAKSVARWIGGLTLIVIALVSLSIALGKLEGALNPQLRHDATESLYALGLIADFPYHEVVSPSVDASTKTGHNTDQASLPIGDRYLFDTPVAVVEVQQCNFKVQNPVCVRKASANTTYCTSDGVAGSCPTGESYVKWHVAANVTEKHQPINVTKEGKIAFWVFFIVGLLLLITPTFIGMFRPGR